jgi:HEPN domain-containing protein
MNLVRSIVEWLRRWCPCRNQQQEDKDRLRQEYFHTALEYHIAARYAAAAGFLPTAGPLAHHALEFYLKGALVRNLNEAQRRSLGHKLKRIWKRYKREKNNAALNRFDQTIRDVDSFERIRYPEEILRHGMTAVVGFARSPAPGPNPPSGRGYHLALDEVDELVRLIFQLESLNPKFFINSMNPHATQFLNHQNRFPM